MSQKEYDFPETYEGCVKRKNELLEKINAYNEALFAETELPYSDEEIEEMQEEYEILNDHLALTEEEKLNKLDDKDIIVNEDGTREVKKTIFDKIHWTTYVYILFGTLIVLLFGALFSASLGTSIMTNTMSAYFEKVYAKTKSMYTFLYESGDEYMMNPFVYWLKVILSYFGIPLGVLLLSAVSYFFFNKRADVLNKKIAFIVFLVHCAIVVVGIIVVLFVNVLPVWKDFYEHFDYNYMVYIYSQYGQSLGY